MQSGWFGPERRALLGGVVLMAARRLGDAPALERFYEVHVEADAEHSAIALDEMVGPLVVDQPDLAGDVIFGAAALGHVEARFARWILDRWDGHRSSLLPAPRTPSQPVGPRGEREVAA